MKPSISEFKTAVRSRNLRIIREAKQQFDLTDGQLFRLAIAAEPTMTRGEWDDLLKEALV